MNVLWITNILFPEASSLLFSSQDLKDSGGWLIGAAKMLEQVEYVKLSIAAVSPLVKTLEVVKGNNSTYYVIPYGKGNLKYNKDYEDYWKMVKDKVNPDIVHIHGTEYSHGLAYINVCGNDNVVVSIQGLKSSLYSYYYYGLSKWDIYSHITFRDIIRGNIIHDQIQFKRQGLLEREIICKVKYIIGRTSWDRANTWAINPKVKYYFCNETLRPEFYDGSKWSYEKCLKHSIFLSQASYPIKGLHQVLRAMPIILKKFPDTQIRIAGRDITDTKGFKQLIKLSGYGSILKSLINKLRLKDHIVFLGPLNADEMKREYLSCNVFVCPSSIENSPNSLGEAQILGTPVIASYVGGVMDMMKGDEEHLYRFEEICMLAEKICTVFANKNTQTDMIEIASDRHSQIINLQKLLAIYHDII